MNTLLKKILSVAICLFAIGSLNAQTLQFFFVGPTAAMNSTFGAASTQGFMDHASGTAMMSGYRYVPISAANVAQFRTMAAGTKILATYDSITTASTGLRRKLNRVMSLAGNRISTIFIFLTSDRGNKFICVAMCLELEKRRNLRRSRKPWRDSCGSRIDRRFKDFQRLGGYSHS
jgi:hypothetical protein